jgi:hypothetical protein
MIAHLQDGRYGAGRVLQEASARQMHQRLFAHDPRVSGMAYGFAEVTLNQQRILKHNGALPGSFNTLLALLPEQGVGLYVSYNAALYHFQMNGPAWSDAQPWDMLVFAIAAVIVVLLNRRTMFTRAGAVTEVLMPTAEAIPTVARIPASSNA